jgi:type II secretion system protein D
MFRLVFVSLLAAVLGTRAFAQDVPPPADNPAPAPAPAPAPVALPASAVPATPPRPGLNPRVPGVPGAAPAATAGLPEGDTIQLQFGPSSDVKDVLRVYETLTGYRLLYDNQVVGPVPIVVNERVPHAEAQKIIEICLLMNGFSLVPTEDPHIWKVFGIGKSPRTGGVPLYTDVDLIPDKEQFVTVLFKLRYADPQELGTTLLAAFPANPALQGQSIIPLPKSQALLVTENTPILRQLIRVIHELDLPPAKVESKFFSLERADAKDVQEKLENILTKKNAGQPTNPVPGGAAPRPQVTRLQTTPEGLPLPANVPPEAAATTIEITAGPNEENIIQGKIQITADTRTNRIHIVTRPANMEFISDLIKDFDANIPFGIPAVRPLRFVNAADIFEVIVKSISEPGQDKDVGAAGGSNRPGGGNRGNTNNNNQFANARGGTGIGNDSGFGGTGGGAGGGGSATFSESLSAEEKSIEPKAVTVGNTRIIADNRANSIIVVGNRDVKEKLFKVIDKLDVRAPQVMLHTCIGQLTLDDKEQFGVNYILKYGNGKLTATNGAGTGVGTGGGTGTGAGASDTSVIGIGSGGNPTLNIGNLLSQTAIKQIGTAGGGGLSGFFTAGDAFTAIVTALENSNKFKVTSRPSLFTSNNKKAVISSGSEIAIPTNIQSGFNGGAVGNSLVTNSSVQFKTVALQLEILPLINSEREVTLDIVQKIDEVSGSTRIDNNDIPTIATRVLKTTVSVPNRATLVLGGLIKQTYNKSHSGVPYLSKIPLLGGLFRNTSSEKTREELVILIRPEVTMGADEAIRAGEHDQESMTIEPDLESTIIPTALRQRAAPEELMRTPAAPGLRPYSGRPAFKK